MVRVKKRAVNVWCDKFAWVAGVLVSILYELCQMNDAKEGRVDAPSHRADVDSWVPGAVLGI